MLAIEISADMENMLQSVSELTGRSLKELVQEALDRFLEEWEDQQDAVEARQILEKYHAQPGKPFTLDDALNRYGVSREELVP